LWPEDQIALLLRKHLKITGAVLFTDEQTDYRPRTGVGLPAKKEQHSLYKQSNSGCRKDETRLLVRTSALCSLHCFDTDGWVTGGTCICRTRSASADRTARAANFRRDSEAT